MIAKLESISYLQNALVYCEKGGEVLYINKCIGSSSDIYQQMQKNNMFNDRCLKNTFHIKIRIAPEDQGKLNNQNWIEIANDYARKIGFEQNPFAVYIHEENTEKEHIHIVASRIMENNLAVKDNFTHYKNMDFCREMEMKYQLRQVKRVLETLKSNEQFVRQDCRIPPLEEKIASAIKQSDFIDDLVFHLKNMGIKTKIGRGIGFIDEKGVYFKGSAINRKYSLKGIEDLLSYKHQEKEMYKQGRKLKI
ncbi:relaxase/mobilization nuclease domain-containing protein [Flavobacterium frigoris]|uniref:Relaxase/Mobilisation nuclease domain-containing protein n=1 Tax=Flavobacterium frigoris TaxID=229204 RepID=A0A1H9RVY3_FLAFI|nr:relaxase/mobilization nuclease domain-containing protein [Flavobacterium frigoris]SER76313.1 Relaxase/Mobilisation nuclease domain-containing protein [Flavobacterium frigoris]